MSVLLDGASKGPTTVITGGLHASATSNVFNGARADLKHDNSSFAAPQNRYWFEVTNNFASLATDSGTGVTPAASPNYTNLANNAAGGLIVYRSGAIWLNGSVTAFVVSGGIRFDSVMFAIDFDSNLLWAKTPGCGGWNSDATANPDLGTGGIDISAISAGGLYPVGLITSLANAFDAQFSGTTVNTPPSTFGPWDPSVPPPPPVPTRHVVQSARMPGFTSHATATAQAAIDNFTMISTELRDTCVAEVAPSIGMDMLATEARDTCHLVPPATYNVGGLNTPDSLADEDVIYVLENNETIYVEGDFSSSFVIPSDGTMYAT